MPHNKPDVGWLWDMFDAATAIVDFVSGKSFEDYVGDRMLRGAVERHIEIIGEAARHVSHELQIAHPEIPWRGIMAQRHVLAHDYGEIQHDLIWRVVTVHIPNLIEAVKPLLPDELTDVE